jgi:hypothetical protein
LGIVSLSTLAVALPQAPTIPASPASASINGNVTQIAPGRLTIHSARGDVQVNLPDGTRLLRVPPGAKDLKSASPISAADISVGDRAVVLGRLEADQTTLDATRVLVMNKSDVASVHAAELREWQTRGIEGIVRSIDPSKLEITIAAPNHPPTPGNLTHPVVLTTTAQTAFMRYAPDSIQFADAAPSSLAALKEGDQLRALGTRSDDGSHYAADKVVSGTFRNIGATVTSVDASSNTLTVKNLSTNKPVVVHVNADCKMHELPEFVAQMIARLSTGSSGGQGAMGGGGAMRRGGGMSNLSQALERMPAVTLNDLKRGEPVVIFSTEGKSPSEVTAIYILTGVEPILAALPKGGGEMNLGTWNLSLGGASAGGGDAGP